MKYKFIHLQHTIYTQNCFKSRIINLILKNQLLQMNINFILFSLFLSSCVSSSYQQIQNVNNIVFDLADLTVDCPTNNGVVHLEAFKSSINDLIIEKKETDKYGQLNWLSIGYPNLVLSKVGFNSSALFIMKTTGFEISIEMLTSNFRNIFTSLVKRKYKIYIEPEQIVSLIPANFECHFSFFNDIGEKILISGKAIQLSSFPLKVSFTAPVKTKERTHSLKQRRN